MKIAAIAFASLVGLTSLACSSSDNNNDPGPGTGLPRGGDCLASAFKFKETKFEDSASSGKLFLHFDVTNTSTTDYDVGKGSPLVELKFTVTTTDGAKYETTDPTVTKLSPGATSDMLSVPEYGQGKTYKSYSMEAFCK